ncbi:MAG: FlgD immunoglobulin-like domain containing protein [Armatimonas sp.]
MASSATKRNTKKLGRSIGAGLALLLGLTPSLVHADTTGGVSISDPGIPGAGVPGVPSTTPPPTWGIIKNEYVFCNVGVAGTYTVTPITYALAGRISFGNTGGARFTSRDNFINLCGRTDDGGPSSGGPYPNNATNAVGDWPAYVRTRVDGDDTTQRNLGYTTNDVSTGVDFRPLDDGPALISQYAIATNIQVRQVIRLRRSMVRFEWTVINNDVNQHNVDLRWNVNVRQSGDYYFRDPGTGINPYVGESDRTNEFIGSNVPSDITIFNRRGDDLNATDHSFAMRQIFRGSDATVPSRIFVGDSNDLYPGDTTASGSFLPPPVGSRLNFFRSGIATAAYYSVSVAGGQSATIVAYAGNGGPTEQIGTGDASSAATPDFVMGLEGPEALVFNTAGALSSTLLDPAKRANPNVAEIGSEFLTAAEPIATDSKAFRIYASVYNQKLRNPQFGVLLSGVTMSLTLPQGLRFAIDPVTGQRDVASKSVASSRGTGLVDSDDDGVASWVVEATGERFGSLNYQVSASIQEPSPRSRSISRTIDIPTPPVFSYKPKVFQMTGFPFDFDPLLSDNGNPNTVLNTNVAGQDNLVIWEYVGNVRPNKFPPYERPTKLVPGRGYFFLPNIPSSGTPDQRIILLKGAKPVANQAPLGTTALPTRIQLEQGWNLISNPYVYEIPLNYVRFLRNDDNPALDKVNYQAAVSSGLIRGGVYFYSPTDKSYQFLESTTSPLTPWQGYWLYANQRVLLEYTAPSTRGSLIQQAPLNSTNSDPEPPTRKVANVDNNWRQQFVVRRNDGAQDKSTFIGVASGVTADDSRNWPKPPPIADYVQANLVREGTDTRYATLLQGVGGKKTWELEVLSDKDGSATLLWPESAKLPRRVQLSITDLQTNRTVQVRSVASLPITLRQGVASRYRITAQMAASQQLRITQLTTTRSGRSGGTSIAVRVSKDATITARVLTQSGRVVQVLASGRAATSGEETKMSWNGRNANGSALPAGIYQVEVVAAGADGEDPVRMSRPLSNLR